MQRPLGFAGVVLACMALCLGTAVGQDTIEEEPILLLQGLAKLAPTEGATNQDALGVAHLRQIAERIAIHVHVQNLEPGAAYDVVLTLAGETEPVPLGTITTHDGVPPPPRCFSGQLTAVEEPPDEEGEPEDLGEGDGGHLRGDMPLPEHGDWRDWRDRLHRDRPMAPRGSAYLLLNEDGTELSYTISTRGIGEVESASLTIGEGAPYDVTELRGSIPVSPEEIEALQAGEGTVAVIGTEATVEGSLSPCIPQEWRDRMATRKAGRGSLRLDTARGDEVPVDTLVGLEGATIDVLPTGGEADAVLTGVVGEIVDLEIRCGHWRPRPPPPGDEPEEPAEGETEAVDVGGEVGAGGGEVIAELFSIGEIHDARFLRGDANDDQLLDLSDALAVLLYLFQGSQAPYCLDAADADDNGAVEISDPILVLGTLFLGDGRIAAPYPIAGYDATADALFCDE